MLLLTVKEMGEGRRENGEDETSKVSTGLQTLAFLQNSQAMSLFKKFL